MITLHIHLQPQYKYELFHIYFTVASTVGKTLGLSALAGLASEGASQIVKEITGGQIFKVPNKELYRLAMMSELLNKGQIRDLANAHQLGKDMLFKITQKQVGNGIGSIIASIGIPMILDAIRGKGVGRGGPRMGSSSGGAAPRIGMPMAPPAYIGSWGSGRGRKKKDQKKRSRFSTRKKQPIQWYPNSRGHSLRYRKTVPMSNFDLLELCKYLKIPIKNVLRYQLGQNFPFYIILLF